jgi:hypothetical protein
MYKRPVSLQKLLFNMQSGFILDSTLVLVM